MLLDYVNYITSTQISAERAATDMTRLIRSRTVKKLLGAAFLFLCAAVLGLLFYHFSSIRYQVSGASGTVSGSDVTFSLVFAVFACLFYFVCGLCAMPGGVLGLTILTVLAVGGGLAGFLGYAHLLGPVQSVYFLLIAPIVPIIETFFRSFSFANADLVFFVLPALLCACKFAFFSFGRRLHSRPEVLERSIRRIDRFYEYRRPIEEEIAEGKTA